MLEPNVEIFFYIQEAAECLTVTWCQYSRNLYLYYTSPFTYKPLFNHLVKWCYNAFCPRTSKHVENMGGFGCPHNRGTNNTSILSLRKDWDPNIKGTSRHSTSSLKIFAFEILWETKEKKPWKPKKKKKSGWFDTGHADTSAQPLASSG